MDYAVAESPLIGSIGDQYYGVATGLVIHACRFPGAGLPYARTRGAREDYGLLVGISPAFVFLYSAIPEGETE